MVIQTNLAAVSTNQALAAANSRLNQSVTRLASS